MSMSILLPTYLPTHLLSSHPAFLSTFQFITSRTQHPMWSGLSSQESEREFSETTNKPQTPNLINVQVLIKKTWLHLVMNLSRLQHYQTPTTTSPFKIITWCEWQMTFYYRNCLNLISQGQWLVIIIISFNLLVSSTLTRQTFAFGRMHWGQGSFW